MPLPVSWFQLARKPRWVAGIAADGLGFAAQAAALAIGRLVVVQPLLATAVVFSLPLNAKLGAASLRAVTSWRPWR